MQVIPIPIYTGPTGPLPHWAELPLAIFITGISLCMWLIIVGMWKDKSYWHEDYPLHPHSQSKPKIDIMGLGLMLALTLVGLALTGIAVVAWLATFGVIH